MRVKEVMRRTRALGGEATLEEVTRAIATTGCETIPIVNGSNGSAPDVCQLVAVRDLPKLRHVYSLSERGHAIGGSVIELLAAIGRRPGSFPTVSPDATLTDAWGIMSEECVTDLPVVEGNEVIGIVSLVVSFSEFPNRSPAAGFW